MPSWSNYVLTLNQWWDGKYVLQNIHVYIYTLYWTMMFLFLGRRSLTINTKENPTTLVESLRSGWEGDQAGASAQQSFAKLSFVGRQQLSKLTEWWNKNQEWDLGNWRWIWCVNGWWNKVLFIYVVELYIIYVLMVCNNYVFTYTLLVNRRGILQKGSLE